MTGAAVEVGSTVAVAEGLTCVALGIGSGSNWCFTSGVRDDSNSGVGDGGVGVGVGVAGVSNVGIAGGVGSNGIRAVGDGT